MACTNFTKVLFFTGVGAFYRGLRDQIHFIIDGIKYIVKMQM